MLVVHLTHHQNPLKISDIKYDAQGRPSIKYIGKEATIIINPEKGKIITVYPTSTQRLNSILKIRISSNESSSKCK